MLTPYDATWPVQFEEIADELRRFGSAAWTIEHIGSTSIPGLRAKPIIDVAVRIRDIDEYEDHREGPLDRARAARGLPSVAAYEK